MTATESYPCVCGKSWSTVRGAWLDCCNAPPDEPTGLALVPDVDPDAALVVEDTEPDGLDVEPPATDDAVMYAGASFYGAVILSAAAAQIRADLPTVTALMPPSVDPIVWLGMILATSTLADLAGAGPDDLDGLSRVLVESADDPGTDDTTDQETEDA